MFACVLDLSLNLLINDSEYHQINNGVFYKLVNQSSFLMDLYNFCVGGSMSILSRVSDSWNEINKTVIFISTGSCNPRNHQTFFGKIWVIAKLTSVDRENC